MRATEPNFSAGSSEAIRLSEQALRPTEPSFQENLSFFLILKERVNPSHLFYRRQAVRFSFPMHINLRTRLRALGVSVENGILGPSVLAEDLTSSKQRCCLLALLFETVLWAGEAPCFGSIRT